MEVTAIELGKELTLFTEKHPTHTDGSYFEAMEDKAGFIMATYLGEMSSVEITYMCELRINVRMIREGNKILFITRYGNTPLMFEVSFDPTLYKDERAMQIAFDNHMVTFIGVERFTNQVKTIRQANFPMKLKQACITAWSGAYQEQNYSEKYSKWIQGLYQYDSFELWDIAENVGFFGEKGVFE